MPDVAALRQQFTPREVKVLPTERQLTVARFSPDGQTLCAAGMDNRVFRWNVSAETIARDTNIPELPAWTGHRGWISGLAFHPQGEWIFSADSFGKISCWPFAAEQPAARWEVADAHDGWIRGLTVSADGRQLASCGRDGKVKLWSTENGQPLRTFEQGEDTFAVLFHPTEPALISGDFRGRVKIWNTNDGTLIRELNGSQLNTLSRLQDCGGVRCLAFGANATTLAVGGTVPKNGGSMQGTPTVLVFEWATGQLQKTMTLGRDGDVYVMDLHWHPGEFWLAVTSGNPGTGQFLCRTTDDDTPFFLSTQPANSHSIAVHPNGRRIVVAGTNRGSNGNGRPMGEYRGNFSPLHFFEMPAAT